MALIPEHSAMVCSGAYSGQVAATKIAAITTPCNLHSVVIVNTVNAPGFLQMFDAASADVTVGTTTPDHVIPVGPSATLVLTPRKPVEFATAMTLAGTTTRGGNTANALEVFLTYQDDQ